LTKIKASKSCALLAILKMSMQIFYITIWCDCKNAATECVSGTEVPALSFSLIQNSKTKYKINKHFIQLKLQTP
jgi:hypothetical protein